MATPTSRTLDYLRKCGFLAAVVEVWLPMHRPGRQHEDGPPGIRRDLFGFADVIGIHPIHREVLLVQCTTEAHLGDRLTKAKRLQELAVCLRAGVKVEFWGWRKRGGHWEPRRVAVTGKDLVTVLTTPRKRAKRERQRGLFDGAKG